MPIERLPKPIGTYEVGVLRDEFSYDYKGNERKIPLFFYYPANTVAGIDSYPYAFKEVLMGHPDTENMLETKTYCYEGANISDAKGKYPVVIFNFGFGCFDMINTILCSDLASSGYIVVVCSHPEDSLAVRYLDGTTVPFNPEYTLSMTKETMDELTEMIEQMKGIEDQDELVNHSKKFFSKQGCYNDRMEFWVEDTKKVAGRLEDINNGKIVNTLTGKMDMDLGIGLSGHSYGGSTAMQSCRADERFVCGINIDGGAFGDTPEFDVTKPFLTIGNPHMRKLNIPMFLASSNDTYHLSVLDADHMGFTDQLFTHREGPGKERLGTREPNDFRDLITKYHIKFFKKYLLKNGDAFEDLGYKNTEFFKK